MITSKAREQMRSAFGFPFTSKKKVMNAMGYSRHTEIRKYFYGLQRVGQRFFTDDVIEKILEEVTYEA